MKVGVILNDYGIQNVFCKGNVWQCTKAVNDFNSNDKIKVIMLSSKSSASGMNLTKAEMVILLDPVSGSYKDRRNTEWQAIGRAVRMGQTKQVQIVRFIIKNTIEDDIYKENMIENAKQVENIKIFELTEDVTNLDEDKINEINKAAKESKPKKIIKKVTKKVPVKMEVMIDDDDY
jgi:SNF2 family DNA or RNA helicase